MERGTGPIGRPINLDALLCHVGFVPTVFSYLGSAAR
jgi:hypothetical protein